MGWLAVFGVAGIVAGFAGGGSPFAKPSWSRILVWAGITFAFGVWAGFVAISKFGGWVPHYRRWLHSATFILLICLIATIIASPSVGNLLSVAGIAGLLGYFGEVWVERI